MPVTSCLEFERPVLDGCNALLDCRLLFAADGTVVFVLENDPLSTVNLSGMLFQFHHGA